MIRTCAAEWSRLWTVRATWLLLGVAAALMVAVGFITGSEAADRPPTGASAWTAASFAAMPAQFALLTLALLAVTSDYATGGIVPSLQWTPRRGVLFLARTTTAVVTAAVLGVLAATASTLTAHLVAGPVLPLDGVGEALPKVAVVFAAGAALAVGLGFLARGTAGALVVVFLAMLVLPLILRNFGYEWSTAVADVLPGSGVVSLLLQEIPGMTTTRSVVTLLCWAVGALALGWVRFAKDDANR
ncbi:hypothetical protein GCM10022243_15500 [Saccharothrix violaceirubra]|uniref:ABC-2 type transport system permease protein n=1 Tax=Saccharothrix violaceirubra TaxID=413306 RepID=A0A7W7WXR8_9PSEU|nr:hypothetical protein [Saccharothrix violaceirubra]MBB4967427.1 ABC-2 type transport system permease protein [Saccharothrix violaceirubra]